VLLDALVEFASAQKEYLESVLRDGNSSTPNFVGEKLTALQSSDCGLIWSTTSQSHAAVASQDAAASTSVRKGHFVFGIQPRQHLHIDR